jgi:hypothetical protein
MKIIIYYLKDLFNQSNLPAQQMIYQVAWLGSATQLQLKDATEDLKILERIFDIFNIGKPPAGAENLRSLSVGDVVELAGKAYKCKPIGWELLEDFKPELEMKSFSSLAGFERLIRPGAKVFTINHHAFTGERKEGEMVFGDVSRGIRTVSKIEDTKFWLHDPKSGDNHNFDQWSDSAEFKDYRIEDNKLTVCRKVGERGLEKGGEAAEGDGFDRITFWLVD